MTTFTRSHAIIAHGKRARVSEEGPLIEIQAGNEYTEIIISLDRPAAEHLYRTLEAKLFLSEIAGLPDHHYGVA